MTQISLLGEPPLDKTRSQWFTPVWICRLLVRWISPTARVIEPSCGSGNMIAALLERGHDPSRITGVELDPEWAEFARARFDGAVRIITGSFFHAANAELSADSFDTALGNPPFENNIHEQFVLRCLDLAPQVAFVLPVSIEFSRDRDHDLWAKRGIVCRRAKLPDRVKYGGPNQASFDSEALKIKRRSTIREPDEINIVMEEVWTRRTGLDLQKGSSSDENRTVQSRTAARAHSRRTNRQGR